MNETITGRPSQPILDSGLKFDHFQPPFTVFTPFSQPIPDFVSAGDALDFAIKGYERSGGAYTVLDSIGELVYIVE